MKLRWSGRAAAGSSRRCRLLASGKVRVGGLISEEFPLDRAPEAFARAATKGVLKVLLRARELTAPVGRGSTEFQCRHGTAVHRERLKPGVS